MDNKFWDAYNYAVDELEINKDVIGFAFSILGTSIETLNDVLYWSIGCRDIEELMNEELNKEEDEE